MAVLRQLLQAAVHSTFATNGKTLIWGCARVFGADRRSPRMAQGWQRALASLSPNHHSLALPFPSESLFRSNHCFVSPPRHLDWRKKEFGTVRQKTTRAAKGTYIYNFMLTLSWGKEEGEGGGRKGGRERREVILFRRLVCFVNCSSDGGGASPPLVLLYSVVDAGWRDRPPKGPL
jgi:hypothetical protein